MSRGRPKTDRAIKSERLHVVVTEDEKDRVIDAATKAGQTVSSLCRDIILGALEKES